MFAVIKTGGKQYRVAAEDVITVEKLAGEPGDIVEIGEVLMVGGDTVTVGNPVVAGATVAGEVVEHNRGAKVIAFKKRRRKNSRRKHRPSPGLYGAAHHRDPHRRCQAVEGTQGGTAGRRAGPIAAGGRDRGGERGAAGVTRGTQPMIPAKWPPVRRQGHGPHMVRKNK